SKIEDLKSKLSEANTYWYSYKLGVAQLEERLTEHRERGVKNIEKIRTLEFYYEGKMKYVETLKKELETLKEEKDVVDEKLARLRKFSKDLEDIIESQRSDKVKEGVGYNVVPPPAADLYRSPKKDLSWTGLPEFADDTITNYSRPSPTIESTSAEGPEFVLHKKPCFNGGDFSHLANDYRKMVQRETTRSQNHAYKSPPLRPDGHRPHGPPMRPMRSNINDARPKRTSAVRPQYRAPWVPTVNKNFPPVNRKLPTCNSNVSTVCCCCSRHVNSARPKAVINKRNRVKDV
nr:hypothetical protein [Tanacetum cinerariifolium]